VLVSTQNKLPRNFQKTKKKKKTATEANEMTNEQAENNLPRAVQSGIVDRQGFVFSNWLCFSLNS
jgi:hypothetical protein